MSDCVRSRDSGRRYSLFTAHYSRALALALTAILAAGPAHAGEAEWRLMHDQASAHLQRGNLEQAERFAEAALKEAEPLGADHRAVELTLSTLSLALRLQGKHAQALPLVERLVAIRTRRYGPEDASTAVALHNNAEILIAQDRLVEAAALQGRALAVFEKKLGAEHIHTATALHNLGAIALRQEQFKDAERYLRRALAAKEKALKPGHLSIAHTLDNLSAALEGQGRQIEAERFKRRAERIRLRAQAQKQS